MGTKDEDMPAQPVEKTKFLEDMDERELSRSMDMPAGLQNLGNTCYLHATVQCLKTVPELRKQLTSYSGSVSLGGGEDAVNMTAALRDLYSTMDRGSTVPPIILLQVLHMAFPRFAERGENGGYQQQDANECWVEVLRMLQAKTNATESSTKCNEAPEEAPSQSMEKFLQFSCYIDKDVKYLHTGLKNRLTEVIEKHSPTLNRDTEYTKTMAISRLPGYMTIQMVRFHFKQKEAVNAKVLKDIKFPVMLDMFDMCSKELQDKLRPVRTEYKAYEDWLVDQSVKVKGKNRTEAEKAEREAQDNAEHENWWMEDDVGSNNSGYYVLQAVLTHKGRSSNSNNSGYYVL